MYTPWPFTSLFQALRDEVEIFDVQKYNFVTPIIKPEAMDRTELLDRVMNNYRRAAGLRRGRRFRLACRSSVGHGR